MTSRQSRPRTVQAWCIRRRSLTIAAAAIIVPCGFAASAQACPYCQSQTGQQVAAELFGKSFWTNAALTLAPLPLLAAIVVFIHYGGVPWLHKQSPP